MSLLTHVNGPAPARVTSVTVKTAAPGFVVVSPVVADDAAIRVKILSAVVLLLSFGLKPKSVSEGADPPAASDV